MSSDYDYGDWAADPVWKVYEDALESPNYSAECSHDRTDGSYCYVCLPTRVRREEAASTIEPLRADGSNYHTWSADFESFLRRHPDLALKRPEIAISRGASEAVQLIRTTMTSAARKEIDLNGRFYNSETEMMSALEVLYRPRLDAHFARIFGLYQDQTTSSTRKIPKYSIAGGNSGSQQTNAQFKKASLLGLPGELRNRIYEYMLSSIQRVQIRPESNVPLVQTDFHTSYDKLKSNPLVCPSGHECASLMLRESNLAEWHYGVKPHALLQVCGQLRTEFSSMFLAEHLQHEWFHFKIQDFDFTQLRKFLGQNSCKRIIIELVGRPTANAEENLKDWLSVRSSCDKLGNVSIDGKTYVLDLVSHMGNNVMEMACTRTRLAQHQAVINRVRNSAWNEPSNIYEDLVWLSDHCHYGAGRIQEHILWLSHKNERPELRRAWEKFTQDLGIPTTEGYWL
ncbi:hypothetical protein HII31_07351 [Pseudocercospora fuligena]|uniref:Uncharacterized protein n=1 Tax=Pseudocercospora fuligena TaxID=685502 RepID=A0A8H6RHR5_9PEZI|nr:hypothetical protein HII31_07351 [Pseudocercospora fuligena]